MGQRAPAAELLDLIVGYRAIQAIYVAARLGLADRVSGGPATSEDRARATGAQPRALHRLLRALVGLGLFAVDAEGRFGTTETGALLRSDVPGSLRGAAIFYGDHRHWNAWGRLHASVMSGETAFGPRDAGSFVEGSRRDPEGARIFNEGMTSLTAGANAAVAVAYDFSPYRTVVDVGGGQGALICAILARAAGLRGILFDIPPVAESAREYVRRAGMDARCEVVPGDCFAAVPAGGDVYVLKWVIHDWNDELSRTILRNCRRAVPPHGKLLVVERVVSDRLVPTPAMREATLADLNMLILTGGCERTESEYGELLATAGFGLERVIPTDCPSSIIEAAPR
jgi:hypothetical protein